MLGKYVESNPDLTVEDAVKRYKGSEKDFSDFKLLFPNEPMPQTEAEKKTAAPALPRPTPTRSAATSTTSCTTRTKTWAKPRFKSASSTS